MEDTNTFEILPSEQQDVQLEAVPNIPNVRYIADDMVHIHYALEQFFEYYKTSVRNEIKAEMNEKQKQGSQNKNDKVKTLRAQNRDLKGAISDAISEIMNLKNEKKQYEKELLNAYTNNVNLSTENENLKKQVQQLTSMIYPIQNGMMYLLQPVTPEINSDNNSASLAPTNSTCPHQRASQN